MVFHASTRVRFAHVDGASIVFYPRYFEMLNGAVEDWFAEALGMDFKTMHTEQHIAVPTVKLEAEFLSPSELGDELTISISPREIGRTSCCLDVLFSGDGRHRLRARVVLVCMDLKARRAVPWPEELRARMTGELSAAA